jgi:hypothetical protein
MPRSIKINRIPLDDTGLTENQFVTLSHMIVGVDTEYQLDHPEWEVKPDGELVEPFYLLDIPEGSVVRVQAKTVCGDTPVVREIEVPSLITWEAGETVCEQEDYCEMSGYQLSPDGTTCTLVEQIEPTTQDNPIKAAASILLDNYSAYGTRIYAPDFNVNGSGTLAATINAASPIAVSRYWMNRTQMGEPSNIGPMNRSGIWTDDDGDGVVDRLAVGRELQVTYNLLMSVAKTVYIGVGGDNQYRLTLDRGNGPVVIVNNNQGGTDPFRWWHVYPVDVQAGNNLISITGTGDGSTQDSVAMIIYDNTLEELLAATSDAMLNIRFDTKNLRGGSLRIVTCPPGYQAVNVEGDIWMCQRLNQMPSAKRYTGIKFVETRIRLRNGQVEYEEQNVAGGGEGPYFPPYEDPTCVPPV